MQSEWVAPESEVSRLMAVRAADGLFILDRSGRVTFMNPAAEAMFGWTREETIGRELREVLHREHTSPDLAGRCFFQQCLQRGQFVDQHDDVFVHKDGSVVPVTCTNGPTGPGQGMAVLVQDLRARAHAWEHLPFQARLFETISETVFAADLDGRVLYWSRGARDVFGYTAQEMLGQSMARIYVEPGLEEFNAHLDQLRRAGEVAGEWLGRHKDARPLWVDLRITTIRDAAGRPRFYLGLCRDITARRMAEQELRESRARLEFLSNASALLASSRDFESTLAAVARTAIPTMADWSFLDLILADGSTSRVQVAHADPGDAGLAERVYQFPPRGGADHPPSRGLVADAPFLIEEYTREDMERAAQCPEHLAVMQAARPKSFLVIPLFARGRRLGVLSLFFAAASGRRYQPSDRELAIELGRRAAAAVDNALLFREIEHAREELRVSERRSKDAYEAAVTANRRKDEFLAMLGHELRNPLAPIITALQLLRLKGAWGTSARELDVVERQVRHMVGLVDDLLDVSRITRGKIQLKKRRLELSEIVTKAIEMTSPLLEQRAHRLSVQVSREGLPLEGDPERLAQVVSNLLSNAAKYTPPGGSIQVEAHREGGEVRLRVKDDGEGIPALLLPQVFDLFVQSERTVDRSQGGLGLGLTIAKSIVELHGGHIAAASEGPGTGSEFTVCLPVPPLERPDDARSAALVGEPGPGHGRGLRVLVVDDNVDAAELLSELLGSMGFETRTAADGLAALQQAEQFRPDIALLDIGLPVMDGYDVARRLRALPGTSAVRLIAVTGYGQDSDRERTLREGFVAHLVKPVEFEKLRLALEMAAA